MALFRVMFNFRIDSPFKFLPLSMVMQVFFYKKLFYFVLLVNNIRLISPVGAFVSYC